MRTPVHGTATAVLLAPGMQRCVFDSALSATRGPDVAFGSASASYVAAQVSRLQTRSCPPPSSSRLGSSQLALCSLGPPSHHPTHRDSQCGPRGRPCRVKAGTREKKRGANRRRPFALRLTCSVRANRRKVRALTCSVARTGGRHNGGTACARGERPRVCACASLGTAYPLRNQRNQRQEHFASKHFA
eukprot:505951-Rhodomonas_salina.1